VRNFAIKFFGKHRGGNVVSKGGGGALLYFAGSADSHVAQTPTTMNAPRI
jgi:hypothetical protein